MIAGSIQPIAAVESLDMSLDGIVLVAGRKPVPTLDRS
jgi:hypothetical protein